MSKVRLQDIEDINKSDIVDFEESDYQPSLAEGDFADGDKTKLDTVENNATADQSDAEIETAYNNQVDVVLQAEAEAGTSTTVRRWTAERVKQAIESLSPAVVSGLASVVKISSTDTTTDFNQATETFVPWDTQDVYNGQGNITHDTSTNNTRINFPTAGEYAISININFSKNGSADRATPRIRFKQNGSTYLTEEIRHTYIRDTNGHDDTTANASLLYEASANDYLEVSSILGADAGPVILAGATFGVFKIEVGQQGEQGVQGEPGADGDGDVNGPASSTDNGIARYDGTTGKVIQNSGVIIDDNGRVGVDNPTPRAEVVAGSATASSTRDLTRGFLISAGSANASVRYLGQFMWESNDASFSAAKVVAYISGEAEQTYANDTTTNTSLRFFTGASGASEAEERMVISSTGVGIGLAEKAIPESELEISGSFTQDLIATDPGDPTSGKTVTWVSDGTSTGNAGDLLIKRNVGGTVVTGNIVNEGSTTVTSNATLTPQVGNNVNMLFVTAQAVAATVAAPNGTATNGDRLIIRIKDNGTDRALTFNAIYRAIGVTLPTTTTASKTLYLGCIYNSADTKWDVNALALEA